MRMKDALSRARSGIEDKPVIRNSLTGGEFINQREKGSKSGGITAMERNGIFLVFSRQD